MATNHSERAYRHIRQKLLDGSVPPGSRLSYGTIGKEIGVSATPVREAVGQLASEGFVELVPQLGAIVRELTRDEAIELYELREALESFAAHRAAERISDRLLGELDRNLESSAAIVAQVKESGKESADRKIANQFHMLDLAFHMTIIESSRNRRMLKVVGRLAHSHPHFPGGPSCLPSRHPRDHTGGTRSDRRSDPASQRSIRAGSDATPHPEQSRPHPHRSRQRTRRSLVD
jgi:DNA-binding GntR family transcriptional regulator